MNKMNTVSFREGVIDVSAGNTKIQRCDYLPDGILPVVDQGENFIGGYWNDSGDMVSGSPPWIVFGDHTRVVKYLDFPFCIGADGVKLLKPRDSNKLNARYLYHFMAAHPISSAGYSRHYKFLKRLEIPQPPIEEQKRIVKILDKALILRQKREHALRLVRELSKSNFIEMFGDPIENPARLPTVPLQDVVSPDRKITYGILKPRDNISGGVPYVRVVDIQNETIKLNTLKRTSQEIAHEYRRASLKAGDLLISIRGHVGRMAIVPKECDGANITQDTARIAVTNANTDFVMAQLGTDAAQRWMAKRTRGAAVKGINLGDLKHFPLLLPSPDKQQEFTRRNRKISKMLAAAQLQRNALDLLFGSLQHRAFSGQI